MMTEGGFGRFPSAFVGMGSGWEAMSEPRAAAQTESDDRRLPLIVAVTGHRDLVAAEIPGIRTRVRDLLVDLGARYPARRVCVMSALAEGADRLVAREALTLGLELIVPLPMPRTLYEEDFKTTESKAEFASLCAAAEDVLELPAVRAGPLSDIAVPGRARDLQYAQLGVFLCAHCHILLALWDGKPSDELGGTAQVVRFLHDDIMPGYTRRARSSYQALVDDESDLAYHIVCSRDRPDGAPNPDFKPLECWWFTADRKQPRSRALNPQHALVFKRGNEFATDAIRFSDRIEREKYPLLAGEDATALPPGVEDIERLHCTADWLAIHYQKRYQSTLRVNHVLAFLMGFMFILYSDMEAYRSFIVALLAFFVLAAVTQILSRRGAWHRKYLDYRALAEGLRVQFYWAAAGVKGESESKFAHDIFLQCQDPELGWIRNVMRIAGLRSDAAREESATGLAFAIREWVGDAESGQLGYFRKKVKHGLARARFTARLSVAALLLSIAVITAILAAGDSLSDALRDLLIAGMGSMLLLLGIRHSYAYSTAERELVKQYEFMLRIFDNASVKLENAEDDAERRQILKGLGTSALNEQAEWILLHRDRSPDAAEIWLMGQ